MFDASVVSGRHYSITTRWIPGMTDDIAAVLTSAASSATSPWSLISVHHFHGAATRGPADDTAFTIRRGHLLDEILAACEPSPGGGPTAHRSWASHLSGALAPPPLPGRYPHLLGPDDPDR